MKISPNRAAVGVVALCLAGAAAIPAVGQDTPEILLPPGFDDSPSAPAPRPAPQPTRAAATPTPAATSTSAASVGASDVELPAGEGTGDETADAPVPTAADLAKYELPEFARRGTSRVGVVAFGNPPFPADAFGRSDGRYLNVLMNRLDAPIASRWLSIALRRALMSRIRTPAGVGGADFAANRAWLLLRMGEPIAARGLVQAVDVEDYTPRLFRVAMEVAMATGDPAALCPLADTAAPMIQERGWPLAQAMCAGLAGEANRASGLLRDAGGGRGGSDIDALLAEKVLGTGAGSRQSVTIEWDGVGKLTSWRYGLAMATGVEIPERLFATAGMQVRYWYALSPAPAPQARVQAAELAAAQGIFSNAGLVDLYSEVEENNEASGAARDTARNLRTAYAGQDAAARVAAMRDMWDDPESPRLRYARLVLTARAATGIAPARDHAEDADQLIASMLTAGFDAPALAWSGIVSRGSLGRALLAVANPDNARIDDDDVSAFRSTGGDRKAQMLFAGLAGLGRLDDGDARSLASALDVAVGASNAWTDAIDDAARRGEAGTVVLLAGVGMQTPVWAGVSPEALFHIVAALRRVGLQDYARMIAVEAVTRA